MRICALTVIQVKTRECAAHSIDPLTDSRWDQLVATRREASVFHTRPWLDALRLTYGYEPVVFTTSPLDSQFDNGLLFCRVQSWLTGSRLVSLPFSDHCDPLVNTPAELQALVSAAEQEVLRAKLDYLEIRPRHALFPASLLPRSTYSYCFHQVDLRPDLAALFRNCHKDGIQRKIRRAERERLSCVEGRSDSILDQFYRLMLLTRRRHQIPPQPRKWFRNLARCMGQALTVRLAYCGSELAAAILTLAHKDTLVYKYGCSDARFHPLGPMQFLLWRSIQEARQAGMRVFDLGRSNCENLGLIAFKDRWGAARSTITYARYALSPHSAYAPAGSWRERIAKRAVACLPDPLFQAVGELLYRHIG